MKKNQQWYIIPRLIFYFSIITVEIARLQGEGKSFLPIFIFAGIILLDSLYILLMKKSIGLRELIAESFFLTYLLFITGGIESPFSPFYFIVILLAASYLSVGNTFLIASINTILYGILIFGNLFFIPQKLIFLRLTPPPFAVAFLKFIIYSLLFYLVAAISAFIAERLRSEVETLRITTDDIINSINSGIITIDTNGKVVFLNEKFPEFIGVDIKKGEKIWDKVDDDLKKAFLELVEKGEEKEIKINNRFLNISTFELKGERRGKGIIANDITERKELEEKIRSYDKMVTLGKFSADIAHEIRNPITSIKGAAEILRNKNINDQEKEKLWDYISVESNRIEKMVRDFLNFAKKLNIELEKTNVSQLIDNSVKSIKFHPKYNKNINISTNVEKNLYHSFDPIKIKEVIINLLENAVIAVNGRGEIAINSFKRDGKLVIEVIDNGEGIPDENLNKIFSPFFSTHKEGYGFGLAIAKKIVELHNGKIEVQSSPKKGTTFRVEL